MERVSEDGQEAGGRLKVVITVPWGSRLGGAENFLWAFVQRVDQERFDCSVVFFQPGPFEREVASTGIRTTVIPTGRLREPHSLVAAVVSMARLLRCERPDVLLNWSGKTHIYGAIAATLSRFHGRLVWFQHGIPQENWLERMIAHLPAHGVLCCSRAVAQAQARLTPRSALLVVHSGVDPPVPVEGTSLRRLKTDLGISPLALVLGTVGRLQPDKGQHLFIEALALLRSRGYSVHGLIVGGNAYDLAPGYEARLRELAVELACVEAVTFVGQVPSATAYFQLMDIAVNASETEGFGLVLVEAMALGVPVVATAQGGPAEIIDSPRSGVLVSERSAAGLANALEPLVADADLRRRMGSAARVRCSRLFSPDRMVAAMETSLSQLGDFRQVQQAEAPI